MGIVENRVYCETAFTLKWSNLTTLKAVINRVVSRKIISVILYYSIIFRETTLAYCRE